MKIENLTSMNQLSRKKAYCLYLRKSRADLELEARGEFETLARHEAQLMEIADRMGLYVAKIYRELVSGESIQDRPMMQQMLNDIYEGKYEGVLVMEVERLARGNTTDQGRVAEAFKISNTKIITPSKTYDPNNEYDEEYFEFSLFMSRKEYKTIRRRMQAGTIASVKEGNYLGTHRPYGYKIVKKGRGNRTLEIFEEEAEVIRMMFNWYVNDGLTFGGIARKLSDMGIPTQRKKQVEWSHATVRDMLSNVIYTGKIRWNARKWSKEYDNGELVKVRRRQSENDQIIVQGKHPAIISEEIFNKAMERRNTRSVPINHLMKVQNPLSGILKCKNCGMSLVRNVPQGKDSGYPARVRHRTTKVCKIKTAPLDDVVKAVIEGLRDHIEDFTFKLTNDDENRRYNEREAEINRLMSELHKLKIKRSNLFELLEDKTYTKEEFKERKDVITSKIQTVEATLERMESELIQPIDYQEKIVKFSDVIEKLKDESVDPKLKNDLLKDIIKRIDYSHNESQVVLDIILK